MSILKGFISHLDSILDVVLFVVGLATGLASALAIVLWLYAYLPDPGHPYIGGSPFTLAQVSAIFGGLGIAVAFSNQVCGQLRHLLRIAGVLYLVSALGFSLFGMILPLSISDELWATQGDILEGMHFSFLLMAMGGFSLGTIIWVSRIHRLLGFHITPLPTEDVDSTKTKGTRMRLSKGIRSMGTPAKAVGQVSLLISVLTLALVSFHPAVVADEQGRPMLGHITLVIWAVAATLIVGIRSYLWNKPIHRCFKDGIVAAAITYGATALVSQVLQDMASELGTIRLSVLWQIAVVIELFVVSVGTLLLINLSTARKSERTFRVGGPE